MSLKPWREIAVPRSDVLKGTFQQAEFAADLTRVREGDAAAEYLNPVLFFQRTFITEGMRLLLDSVVKRLTGRGGDPVIQLQTAFGGGKTHTMMAVYHLAKGEAAASDLQGIPPILNGAGVVELPRANVVVLDGNSLSPNMPKMHDGVPVRTMWGELAMQLGGRMAYEQIRDADISGTSPGKDVLTAVLRDYAPCVILVDELVRYISQFEEGKTLTGGSYDSNLSFIQALTEALKAVPTAMMLASLPESDREAGSQRGNKVLDTLSHYFGRVQALWKPVATEEAFEIVRRRLFNDITDQRAAEDVCRAFADYYVANSEAFPRETQEGRYFERLMRAYPIHPEVFDRLYGDWSALDNFQRTRGVLKLMAKVIHRLWTDGNQDAMIMPGSLPLYDADTRNEVIYYLPQGWDPVLERDIDGERAETTDIESRDARLGSVQACRRAARTIFLGTAPNTANLRGLELEKILLGCTQPGQQVSLYQDALRRLADRLHFINSANNRFWFDTRSNLRREMEERKRRFHELEDVFPELQTRLQRSFGPGLFNGTHVFTPSGDIPDDWSLRLVVLPPDASYSRSAPSTAIERASSILKNRGDQPRQKQNRVIFLAVDYDSVSRLKEQVRSLLAWQSIVADIKDLKLNLDQLQAKQANKSLDDADAALKRMIREAYKWLLAPMQEARPGNGISEVQWENFALNPSTDNFGQEIERVLRENELVITEWAPIHLANLLKTWFWKADITEVAALDVWQKMAYYLYMPRLKDDSVFRRTLDAGSRTCEFFGVAYGKQEGKYEGFSFGQSEPIFFDNALLLIEPTSAAAYVAAQRPVNPPTPPVGPAGGGDVTLPPVGPPPIITPPPTTDPPRVDHRRFFGTVDISPVLAKKELAQIVDEVILQFTAKPGVKVRISVEIEAETEVPFDEGMQRAVRENCNTLNFKISEFETGE